MDTANREAALLNALVELTDSLVDDFDPLELTHRLTTHAVDLLGATAAGLLLTDQHGNLRLLASSTEQARLTELVQLQNRQGPGLDSYATGQPVQAGDLAAHADRWPRFVPEAHRRGFQAVHAVPMRLRAQLLGALSLFHAEPTTMPAADLALSQALADVATIALLQHRAAVRAETLTEQLQGALNSRIAIEQAKGWLAQLAGTTLDAAFTQLRGYARAHHHRLTDLATQALDDTDLANAITRHSANA